MKRLLVIVSLYLTFSSCPVFAQNDATVQQEPKNAAVQDKTAARVIKLEAFQYGFSSDPVEVKKGEQVKLEITSRDVKHGVYIKEYGIKETVDKGEKKEVEFVADKAGTFDIICSVYCGPGHLGMKGKLIVSEQ